MNKNGGNQILIILQLPLRHAKIVDEGVKPQIGR
jgi:hypothetical protein